MHLKQGSFEIALVAYVCTSDFSSNLVHKEVWQREVYRGNETRDNDILSPNSAAAYSLPARLRARSSASVSRVLESFDRACVSHRTWLVSPPGAK